jgi:bifunctional DNase/RNase
MVKKNKKLKNKFKKNLIIIFLLFLFILILSLYLYKISRITYERIPYLSLDDFIQVTIEAEGQNIMLVNGCYRLNMITTSEQVNSVMQAIANTTTRRPNAHDLFVRTLNKFGISLLFVKVHSLIDGTYYGRILLKKGNNILVLDSRPSDAIAIALRFNAPIYLNKELLGYAERSC